MSRWRFKAAVQRLVACMPYPYYWYGLIQTHLTRSLTVTREAVEHKLRACRKHLEDFQANGGDREIPHTVLEIGTGWIPGIPLGLYLCGADAVWTYDIASLLQWGRIKRTIELLLDMHADASLQRILPNLSSSRLASLNRLSSLRGSVKSEEVLRDLGIITIVGKTTLSALDDGGFDLIVSHEVLEYVPREELSHLFRHFARLSADGTVMSHFIDLRDEYSYFDNAISPFNFLRYSEEQWKRRANPLFPLNRLRLLEYQSLLDSYGFTGLTTESRSAPPEALAKVPLDGHFQHMSETDLLVLEAWIKSRKTG